MKQYWGHEKDLVPVEDVSDATSPHCPNTWGHGELVCLISNDEEVQWPCSGLAVAVKCFLEELQVCKSSLSAAGPHDAPAHCAIPGCKMDPV